MAARGEHRARGHDADDDDDNEDGLDRHHHSWRALDDELARSQDELERGGHARPHPTPTSMRDADETASYYRAMDAPSSTSASPSSRGLLHRVRSALTNAPTPTAAAESPEREAPSPTTTGRSGPSTRRFDDLARFRGSHRRLSASSEQTNGSEHSTTSREDDRGSCDGRGALGRHHGKLLRGGGGIGGGLGAHAAVAANCPSSHYYIDAQGRLQARRLWWLYMQLRRLLSLLLPGLKRDSNSFLCALMISNTAAIVVIYVVRLVINDAILNGLITRREDKICATFSSEFLDYLSLSLFANFLLCIPAFNLSVCKLFHRIPRDHLQRKSSKLQATVILEDATTMVAGRVVTPAGATTAPTTEAAPMLAPALAGEAVGGVTPVAAAADGAVVHDDDHPKLKKTYLFTLCELLVILEIPYLVYILFTLLFPRASLRTDNGEKVSTSTAAVVEATTRVTTVDMDLWSMSTHCAHRLPMGVFLVFLLSQVIGLVSYVLRWNQVILFHRLHEHLLYQRGCVPGRARFEYVEESFRGPWWAPKRARQIHAIKKRLYRAAKYDDIEEVRLQIEAAIALDGPDFAQRWYDTSGFMSGLFGSRFVSCQRNPLHIAVAFDNPEIVQELISNGLFDLQQLEKMEVLKLSISWIYRFFFDIVPVLRKSNYARHKTRLVFGPVGLLTSTLLTPLHVAVSMGNTDMVLLLLRYGADPNALAESTHRKFATPPLFWAINRECTRFLLDADANPLFVPGNGYYLTAFEVARIVGNHAVAFEIEKYGGDVALTPLHDASARGFKHEVRFYLEHGAVVDTLGEKVTGYFRRTPLHWAAIRGEVKTMKLLLKFGANIEARDAFGRTALTWACVLNRTKAVQLLLTFGANVNIRDDLGDPLLCICAAGTCSNPNSTVFSATGNLQHGNVDSERRQQRAELCGAIDALVSSPSSMSRALDPEIFALLQSHGIDLRATRECNGDTALHVALKKYNEATAILFVRAGMSLLAVNYLGQRAMDCTMSSSLRYAIKKEAGHRDVMISYCHSHSALARKVRDALEQAHVTTWIDSMDPSGITGGAVWRQEIAQGIRSSALVLALLTQDYPLSQWCMKELAFAKMHNVPVVAIQCEDVQMTEELQVYLWTRQIIDFRPAFIERHVEIADHPNNDQSDHSERVAATDRDSKHGASLTPPDEPSLLDHVDPRDLAEAHAFDASGSAEAKAAVAADPEPPKLTVKHDYDEESFRSCIRLLLDGIHDQIEEHRVRRHQRQKQQQMLVKARSERLNINIGDAGDDDEEEESDLSEVEDNNGLCGLPRSLSQGDEATSRRPTHSGGWYASDLLLEPEGSQEESYIFIAHGDFHLSFCQKLRHALQKRGIRCIVDQSLPAIQYGSTASGAASKDAFPDSTMQLPRLNSNATNKSGYGSGSETATNSVHARQLAAKDAILSCTAVIVVMSPISAKCDMLADQLAFAEDRGKLIVPLMLSLHSLDLAKRYTFSRSVVQHFNVSVGFEQSLERLAVYLQQSTEALERQKLAEERERQETAAHQRRQQRRRRRQQRLLGLSEHSDLDEGLRLGEPDDGLSLSPSSSVHSSSSRISTSRYPGSPSHRQGSGSEQALPATIPILLQASRQPACGRTSGHGWQAGTSPRQRPNVGASQGPRASSSPDPAIPRLSLTPAVGTPGRLSSGGGTGVLPHSPTSQQQQPPSRVSASPRHYV